MKIIRNTFVIFLLSGFWHGANWTFIAWGAYHALLFLPLILMGKNRKYRNTVAEGRLLPSIKEVGQMLLTFFLVTIGWILFRSKTITDAWEYLKGIVQPTLLGRPYLMDRFFYIPVFFAIAIMAAIEWLGRNSDNALSYLSIPKTCRLVLYFFLALGIFMLSPEGNKTQFIYFQF